MSPSTPAARPGARRATTPPADRFWLDDRVIDEIAPALRPHPHGAAALRVYVVLARRANRDGRSWPGLDSIAEHAACSRSTVKRALRLLEEMELVEVAACHDANSRRSTSNLYTLLPPPRVLRAPATGNAAPAPAAARRVIAVSADPRARLASLPPPAAAPEATAPAPGVPLPPVQGDPLPQPTVNSTPGQGDPLPRFAMHPPEGTPTAKERSAKEPDGLIELMIDDVTGTETALATEWTQQPAAAAGQTPPAPPQPLVITEIGLPAPLVWAAALRELAQRRDVSATDLEVWLRPAALAGRDGATLLLGVPNATAQERVQRRLLPAVRAALSAVVGVSLPVAVVVTP